MGNIYALQYDLNVYNVENILLQNNPNIFFKREAHSLKAPILLQLYDVRRKFDKSQQGPFCVF